ncbi:MAG TPA: universal stress protein [Chloroflexi bacterium]|jgi:nucleotide-binding universal stress UspA family protein|nr:universal stress protein [Chloroflexota bacterium]
MFEHILVPLDGSRLAEMVLPHLVALAPTFESRVTLLRVVEQEPSGQMRSVDPMEWRISRAQAKAYLDEQATRLAEVGLETETALLEGQAADRIVEYARSNDADLILLSSHGRSGLSRWNISSVVQKIILQSRVSTMIVRAYQPGIENLTGHHYRRILVPLDCSQRAEVSLSPMVTLARAHDAQVILAHVVRLPEMTCPEPLGDEDRALIERMTERNRFGATQYLDQLRERLEIEAEVRIIVSDSPSVALDDLVESEEVDLVVTSAHGRSARAKWPYGSVTIGLISYGSTPLLIVQDLPADRIEPTRAEVAARERKGH